MKPNEPDHIGTRLSMPRYVLCWSETMFSMFMLTAFWLFTGFKIGFSDRRIKDLLENADFFSLHEHENFTVSACNGIKTYIDRYYWIALIILIAVFVLIILTRWKLCQKNSLVFMKFTAASLFCGGIFATALTVLAFFSDFASGASFENLQNTSLFASFVKSTLFLFLAIGVLILVLAVFSQFLAETIVKNREKSYRRRMAAERNHLEDGL